MKKELYNSLGKAFFTCEYDPQDNLILNNWIGYQTFDKVVAGSKACLDELRKRKCSRVLNDNSLVSGPWDHANTWIKEEWMPQAMAAGLQYFAHVVNPNTLAEASALSMHRNARGLFWMQVFSNRSEAKVWLLQQR
jgi:hypothetical protein